MSNIPEKILNQQKEILKEYQEVKCMKNVLDKFGIKRYEYLKNLLVLNNAKIYSQKELKTFDSQKKKIRKIKVLFNGEEKVFDNLYLQSEYVFKNNNENDNDLELKDVIEKIEQILINKNDESFNGIDIRYLTEDKYSGINKKKKRSSYTIIAKDVETSKKILFKQKKYAVEYILRNNLQNTELEVRIKGQIRDAINGKRNSYLGFYWSYYLEEYTKESLKLKGIEYYEPIPKQEKTKTIYKIINTITGEMYIGTTEKDIETRLYYHKRDYNKPRDVKKPLYKNMKQYGKDNFVIEEIEKVPYDKGFERESYWIQKLDTINNGLNSIFSVDSKNVNYKKEVNDNVIEVHKKRLQSYYDSSTYTEQDIITEYQKVKCMVPVMNKFGIKYRKQLKKILEQNEVYIYPQEEATQNRHNLSKFNSQKIEMICPDGSRIIFDNVLKCYEYLKDKGITNGNFKSVRQKIRNVVNRKKDNFFEFNFNFQY